MDFATFIATFKVGDVFCYTLDEFDMVAPKVIKCVLKEITDDHIIFENEASDHNLIDAKDFDVFQFRRCA